LIVLAAVLSSENDHRGGDSWGIHSPLWGVKKGLGDISRGCRAALLADEKDLWAHTRAASTGEVTVANAHPFELPTLVGAHNGIVGTHALLNELYGRKCAVDSEHIFRHLEERLDLSEVESWGAIEYSLRSRPERAYLCVFNGGSLSVRKVKGGVVWSSTDTALRRALSCAGIGSRPFELDNGTLYYAERGQFHATDDYLPIAPVGKRAAFPARANSNADDRTDIERADAFTGAGSLAEQWDRDQEAWEKQWQEYTMREQDDR
jgi:hypothetical protein